MSSRIIHYTALFALCAGCSGSGEEALQSDTQAAGRTPMFIAPKEPVVVGQSVTLSGRNFPPNSAVFTGQCPRAASEIVQCSFASVVTDRRGRFELMHTVSAAVRDVSCLEPDACRFAATTSSFLVSDLSSPATVLPGTLSVRVDPNTDLVDLQDVTITVTPQFPTDEYLYYELVQCRAGSIVPAVGPLPDTCALFHAIAGPGEVSGSGYRLRSTIFPVNSAPISCSQPESCVLFARTPTAAPGSTPISFRSVAAPARGTVVTTPSPVQRDQPVSVTGSNWTAFATVRVELCPRGRDTCVPQDPILLGSGGTFSASLTALSVITWGTQLFDCTTAPDACVIRVYDSRDPVNTRVEVPLNVQAPATWAGTVELNLRTPLVEGLRVPLSGSGWPTTAKLMGLTCKGAGFEQCSYYYSGASGSVTFRGSHVFDDPFDCKSAPNSCAFVIADENGITASQFRIPLTFSTASQIEVTAYYDSEHEALFQQGLALSGLSADAHQSTGASVLYFVASRGGGPLPAPLPLEGTFSHTTVYTRDRYLILFNYGASWGYAIDQFQKTGALFWSWILAGKPPLSTSVGASF
ncbi:MAG TPA: hypothetical protein VK524_21025 [Polyangiaceae bacterium]|nr:hypothetical protein [Polyangiaceae bacterium]